MNPRIVPSDLKADTWVATDALERELPGYDEVGDARSGRFVAIFYFLWLGAHGLAGPYDISRILAEHPEAMGDGDHPAWGPLHAPHHWGQSELGYYLSDDRYVIRKHAQMLSNAGVDTLVFDVTNKLTYREHYTALCEVFDEMRREGMSTPGIAFLCPFWDPRSTLDALFEDLYSRGLFTDLWFRWKGKPLIMCNPEVASPEQRRFFTFRTPIASYFTGPSGPDQWGWLEVYPQHAFYRSPGIVEEVTVGVAQNAVEGRLAHLSHPGAHGRSYTHRLGQPGPDGQDHHGRNFAEQWERALTLDPEIVFITGWNEWIAGRFREFAGWKAPVIFVDQFNQEYSRDIEPMRGGHSDSYYYQMVSYIRRFKGVREPEYAGPPRTIRVDGDFSDWRGVKPEYWDEVNDTARRDHRGWGDELHYRNDTGRNDFVLLKVAHDRERIYFYARTRDPITDWHDPKWMMLFIDADCDHGTGWEGYDYVLNRNVLGPNETSLERSRRGWDWDSNPVARVPYRVRGCELELAIRRSDLGLADLRKSLRFDFHWADNIQKEGDITEFSVSGDSAPNRRFDYRYEERR